LLLLPCPILCPYTTLFRSGRGSFIESYPLFGYDLKDYNSLFEEKLNLLLELNEKEVINWEGKHRAPIVNQTVYPRPERKLPIWIDRKSTRLNSSHVKISYA